MRSARAVWVVATVVAVLGLASSASSKPDDDATAHPDAKPAAKPAAKAQSATGSGAAAHPSVKAPAPSASSKGTVAAHAPPKHGDSARRDKTASDALVEASRGGASPGEPAPVGPGAGQGDRRIPGTEPPSVPDPASVEKTPSHGEPVATPARPHKVGHPPKQPSPTLPSGAAEAAPDDDARRLIVGGPVVDDATVSKNDPELRELGLAERVLFPKPLVGVRTGWSWDLPSPVDDGAASVEATGLPSGSSVGSMASPHEAAEQSAWLKSLTMPNLPTRLDARVVTYLKFYRDDARGRNILRIWAKKCGKLAPALKAELAKAGLPTDLVWLSLIESGHNPTIVSRAGAAGLWQFIPESARMYGLTVDRWVDERLDPERSTEAAIRYLSDLRARFGSWELAMAAYNMGHGGLLRAERKFNTNDFWALSRYEAGLPWETTLYVPKILATAIVMANKKAFGVDDVEQDAPISFDTVSVSPNVDLGDVARAADVPVSDVLALNAEYLSGRTPPAGAAARRWSVRVPAGRGLATEQRLGETPRHASTPPEPHVVRFGDTLDSVAAEYGTTARELAQQNHVAPDERLKAGSVLLVTVPAGAESPKEPADEEVVVVPARRFNEGTRKRVFYRVVAGDQIQEISATFGVTSSEVALWNSLDQSAHLQPGMTLQIYAHPDLDLARVRYLAEHEARVLIAGTEEFFDYFEAQNGRKRITVVAKKGDTLASVGKRFGMSAGMMERINRIPSNSPVAAGNKVVVYAKGGVETPETPDTEIARELSAIDAPFPDLLPGVSLDGPQTGKAPSL